MITNLPSIINNSQYFVHSLRLGITISTILFTQIRDKIKKFQSKQDTRCDDVAAKLTSWTNQIQNKIVDMMMW